MFWPRILPRRTHHDCKRILHPAMRWHWTCDHWGWYSVLETERLLGLVAPLNFYAQSRRMGLFSNLDPEYYLTSR